MIRLTPFPQLHLVYSQRSDGSFGDPASVKHALNTSEHLAFLKLEHDAQIITVDAPSEEVYHADTVMTNVPNQALGFVVGDCYPVVLFDQQHHAVALLHCGWRSLAKNIIALTLEQMHNTYQSELQEMRVWIGPGICAEHYTQAEPPAQLDLPNWQHSIKINEYKLYSINLKAFIKQELEAKHISPDNTVDEMICTYEQRDDFFSHRRSTKEGDENGRFFVTTWVE
jgi:YfiH family protein